jgi:hypothetical protein
VKREKEENTMLGHLIRKEILDHILSLRFIILSALGAIAIWLSLYSGYVYYHACLKDYQLAQVATEDRIRQLMVADNWSELTAVVFLVHKPPSSMSIFLRGLDPVLGRSISTKGAQWVKQSPIADEPILGVFPPLD